MNKAIGAHDSQDKVFLDMVYGIVCAKYQVCIVFRLVRSGGVTQTNRPTDV